MVQKAKNDKSKLSASTEDAVNPSFLSAQAIAHITNANKDLNLVNEIQSNVQEVCDRVKAGDLSDLGENIGFVRYEAVRR